LRAREACEAISALKKPEGRSGHAVKKEIFVANLVLPSKYAEALFELAREAGNLSLVKDELLAVKKVLDGNERLKDIVFHPGINKDEKKLIMRQVFGDRLSKTTMNFLMLVIDKKRERIIGQVCEIFAEKVDDAQGIKKITVETAYPLDPAEKEKLKSQLEHAMNAKLVMDTRVNAGILGGIIIKERMRLIDASVVQFLKSLKTKLHATKAVKTVKPAKPAKAAKKAAKKVVKKKVAKKKKK
jgi:F-type H+-transporting ATPase subunit delta